MALNSPGVEVTVIDESFYTPAAPGTTPLIVVSTAENKSNAAGTGIAQATLAANVGQVFRITSQKELVDLFGVPFFEKSATSTPIHGSERNEYGLLAAYSFLGVSNSAFVTRADIDLGQLIGQTEAPGANPDDGTWWVDTRATTWGIQEWNGTTLSAANPNGQRFTNKIPLVLTDTDDTKIENSDYGRRPKASVGAIGDYAVVFETVGSGGGFSTAKETARMYYKSAGNLNVGVAAGEWVLLGSPQWKASWPTVRGSTTITGNLTAGSITINGSTVSVTAAPLSSLVATINGAGITGVSAAIIGGSLYLYTDGTTNDNEIDIGGTAANIEELGLVATTYTGINLQQSPHTQVPDFKRVSATVQGAPSGSLWVKTTEPNNGARWRVKQWDDATASWISVEAPIYISTNAALFALDRSGGGVNLPTGTLFVQSNSDENSGDDETPATATFRVWRRAGTGNTTITSDRVAANTFAAGFHTFTIEESITGESALTSAIEVSFNANALATDAVLMAGAINAVGFVNIEAAVTTDNRVQIFHKAGGDFRLSDSTANALNIFNAYNIDTGAGTANFYELPSAVGDSAGRTIYLASNWQPLAATDFKASPDDPTNEPADGQLWYNPSFGEVDIMIHNGTTWVGYQNFNSAYQDTDAGGPQVTATEPTTQSDGVSALVDGDLWISTADIENFPTIYRWNGQLLDWIQLDNTDQTTEEGVLFADARYGLSGAAGNTAASIVDLLTSNYLDPDVPDPDLYPRGMLLWNTRRSGGNVKRYANNYIDITADNPRFNNSESMSAYATDRWITASANNEDGSGAFGRKAQRKVVVQAMKAALDTNQQLRDTERRNFNLMSCPGYPEAMSNLVNLNIERGYTAFVIGDTPLRLPDDATSLLRWGSNELLVTDNGDDGIVTFDEYLGTFYPNGFTTDLGGSNAVVPASHMMLRTIALNDNVAFPWFAPAGTRRGGITNATAVGYIDSLSGEFQTVALNEGQRDTLYELKVNPITFFNGVGLVNYGQKTRARNASALDRINVARLVVFLRGQLDRLAKPYVFEPNDKITRDEIKQAVESLLLELVGLRAIYDFAVVCDETNNTPARIDRNELYVDIAIEPVKAIEFIYIPLRVQNTGEI